MIQVENKDRKERNDKTLETEPDIFDLVYFLSFTMYSILLAFLFKTVFLVLVFQLEKKRKTKNIVTLIIFRVTSSFLTRKFISFIKKI